MSLTSGFFDAMEQGEGNYDRVYTAAEFAHYFSLLVGNGVFPSPDTGLNVLASDPASMTVKIGDGSGWINGYFVTVAGGHSVTLEAASGAGTRIDSIIMQWNSNDRKINIIAKSGTASGDPKPVDLQRDAELWELELAQITVGVGVSSVDQTKIKDMRADSDRCGLVTALLKGIDPSTFLKQSEAEFNQWFSTIMNKISSEDVAGSLLKMIQEVKTQVENISLTKLLKVGDILYSGRIIDDQSMLPCDGSILDTSEYPDLFSVIGYTQGGAYKTINGTSTVSISYYCSAVKLSDSVYLRISRDIHSPYLELVNIETGVSIGSVSLNDSNLYGNSIKVYGNLVMCAYSYKSGLYIMTGTVTESSLSKMSSSSSIGSVYGSSFIYATPIGILLFYAADPNNILQEIRLYTSSTVYTIISHAQSIKITSYQITHLPHHSVYADCKNTAYLLIGTALYELSENKTSITVVNDFSDISIECIYAVENKLICITSNQTVYQYSGGNKIKIATIEGTLTNIFQLDSNTLVLEHYLSSGAPVNSIIVVKNNSISMFMQPPFNPLINPVSETYKVYDVVNQYGVSLPEQISSKGTSITVYRTLTDKFALPQPEVYTVVRTDGYSSNIKNNLRYIKVKE